jgi:hypothetical protein
LPFHLSLSLFREFHSLLERPANALGEAEPLSKAMKYVADASKAGPERARQKSQLFQLPKMEQVFSCRRSLQAWSKRCRLRTLRNFRRQSRF